MSERIDLLKKIVPEISSLLEKRYALLRVVRYNQPIGRRLLAEQLEWGERLVRNEVDFLKNQQLLLSDAAGVSLTEECEGILPQLAELVHAFRGLAFLENILQNKIGLSKVWVVPGDIDKNQFDMRELGKTAGRYLLETVREGWVLAVSGGMTMAEVARQIPQGTEKRKILVVPARGGLGGVVEIQSNTIAAKIATALGGSYRLLYVPENMAPFGMAKNNVCTAYIFEHQRGYFPGKRSLTFGIKILRAQLNLCAPQGFRHRLQGGEGRTNHYFDLLIRFRILGKAGDKTYRLLN
jgi:central glycolytic genes regulator